MIIVMSSLGITSEDLDRTGKLEVPGVTTTSSLAFTTVDVGEGNSWPLDHPVGDIKWVIVYMCKDILYFLLFRGFLYIKSQCTVYNIWVWPWKDGASGNLMYTPVCLYRGRWRCNSFCMFPDSITHCLWIFRRPRYEVLPYGATTKESSLWMQ